MAILRTAERNYYAGETIDDPSDPHIYLVDRDVMEGEVITYTPCPNCSGGRSYNRGDLGKGQSKNTGRW